jgi:hypothetical protein
MKKFLTKFIIFLLPFLISYLFLESKLSQIPTFYSQKKEFLESQLSEIEVLSIGSSHGNSINPQFLSRNGFNLFNDAEDIYYDVQLIEKYLDRMPNLKLIIMPISFFSLEYRIDHSPHEVREPFYKFTWNILPQDFITLLDFRYFSYTAMYGWREVVGYIGNGFVSKNTQKLDSNGWREIGNHAIMDSPEEKHNGWSDYISQESLMMDAGAINGNMSLLRKIIEICQKRHIKVMLITTPVHHYYYDHIVPLKYQTMQDNLNQLVNKYKVPYFNFLRDPRFETADFYVSDHLNEGGAEKFSKLLDPIITNELDHPN